MSLSRKLLIISAILAVYIAVFVSATDPSTGNDVCTKSKKPPFTGSQNPDGECVTTVLGEVPSQSQMISTVIRFPKNGDTVQENTQFTVRTKTNNLATGNFDDPEKQYFSFPQTLDDTGIVNGHSHITIQKIDDDNEPLDPTTFAFFKGLNDKEDPTSGELTASVDSGLPAGNYRVCTMTSSFGHQPVIMPIAKRGAQDDCTRFTVNPKSAKTGEDDPKIPKTAAADSKTPKATAKANPKAVEAKPKTPQTKPKKVARSRLFRSL